MSNYTLPEKVLGSSMWLPVGELMWVTVEGAGIDRSDNGDGSKMKREASIRYKQGTPEAEYALKLAGKAWDEYKQTNGLKSAEEPKSLVAQIEVQKDEETGAKVPTGYIIFKSSTNATFPDGKKAIVPLFDEKGTQLDVDAYEIGNGTMGSIMVEIAGYKFKSDHGITSYLKGVQVITSTIKPKSSGVPTEAPVLEVPDDATEPAVTTPATGATPNI